MHLPPLHLARMTMPRSAFTPVRQGFLRQVYRTPEGRAKVQDDQSVLPAAARLLRRQRLAQQCDVPPARHQAAQRGDARHYLERARVLVEDGSNSIAKSPEPPDPRSPRAGVRDADGKMQNPNAAFYQRIGGQPAALGGVARAGHADAADALRPALWRYDESGRSSWRPAG
jgi:hypothetical protein